MCNKLPTNIPKCMADSKHDTCFDMISYTLCYHFQSHHDNQGLLLTSFNVNTDHSARISTRRYVCSYSCMYTFECDEKLYRRSIQIVLYLSVFMSILWSL